MSNLRITGMASGLDTDQMVKDLMKAERLKLTRVEQNKQYAEWRQTQYKDIIKKLQDMQSSFFDITNSKKNLSSPSMFGQFTSTVKSGGVDSSAVTVEGSASLRNYSLDINSITKLATKDTWNGETAGLQGVKTDGLDLTKILDNADGVNFLVSIDGTTKEIALSEATLNSVTTLDGLRDALNTEIGNQFGSDFNNIVSINPDDTNDLIFNKSGNKVSILPKTGKESSLTELGLPTTGGSSESFMSKKLSDIPGFTMDNTALAGISINGVSDFGITTDDTIDEALNKINKSTAGVTISYDSLKDQFMMKSNKEGSVNNVDISDTEASDFMSFLKLNTAGATRDQGENAVLEINGTTVTKESNTFNFEGALITLNSTHTTGTKIDVNFEVNKEPIKENIRDFVGKYNEIIKELNDLIKEKKDYDYKPLTKDQRKELSEDEVKQWDLKAKAGIIKGSSEISSMLTKMRQAFYEPIEGIGISLKDIGIDTSKSYQDAGKLEIDEIKLNEALENNYENVVKIFTQDSDEAYLEGDQTKRYNEVGIGHRINDIIKDYTRITRDKNGKRGVLIEKAGLVGVSIGTDAISKEITAYNERLATIEKYLVDKENRYYKQFAAMEQALQRMQSQSSWISQQMGGA